MGPFYPRAIVWIILVEVYKISCIPNIKGLGLLVSDKNDFKVLPIGVYIKVWLFHKKRSRSTKGYNFFQTLLDPCPKYCILSLRATDPMVFETIFKGVSPYSLRIHMKSSFDWPSGFWREDIWRIFPIWAYVKQVTPGARPFLSQDYNLKSLGRSLQDKATYQRSKASAFYFQTRRIWKFFPIGSM